MFLNVGKAGSDVSAVSEAIGRLMSLILRMPGSLPASERIRWMLDEMAGIGGGRRWVSAPSACSACPTASPRC